MSRDAEAPVLVALEGVRKSFRRGGETLPVLEGLSLRVRRGEFFALMGPSGSGKSTLLHLIAGLDRPDAGEIRVGEVEITALSEAELAAWRARHVGFVFQFYHLIPVLTALENVELPLLLTGLDRRRRRAHAELALELVGLSDRRGHTPARLSGGQQQRVAIARAIVTDPPLLVADEPTGDLDRSSAAEVLDLLEGLCTNLGKTILLVTHDPRAARRAHTVRALDKGVLTDAREALDPQCR